MSSSPSIEEIKGVVGFEPYAIIQYGSRVGGYASKDSDYDYIYVVEGYPHKIRYIYEKVGENYLSILVVDKQFFEEDVYTGVHGEFVSGRLYGVHKPLYNHEYVYKMEYALKERAVLEELSLLKIRFGGFLQYMRIPIKYFLLARLWKRITAYPPVRYSYYKMFYGPKGPENFRKALDRFEEVCIHFDRRGLLTYEEGYVMDVDVDKVPSSPREVVKYLFRGLSMYYTHGRSANVGVEVFLDEVRSKISRGGESLRIPRELENPEILIGFKDCFFTVEELDTEAIIKSIFGSEARVVKVSRKGFFSNLSLIEVEYLGRRFKLVMKRFPLYSSLIKWLWIYTWLFGYKHFEVDPVRRMYREYHGLNTLAKNGFNVPRVYAVVWPERVIVEEYVEGVRLDRYEDRYKGYRLYGEVLAKLHQVFRVSLGDTKPQNVIIRGDEVYLLDLEQFGVDNRLEWDLGEAVLYSFIFFRNRRYVDEIVSGLLDGYLSRCRGCRDVIENILNLRIVVAFLPLVPLNLMYKVRKVIERKILSS